MSGELSGAELLEHLDLTVTLIIPWQEERTWEDFVGQEHDHRGPRECSVANRIDSWLYQPRNEAIKLAEVIDREILPGPPRRTEIGHMHTVHYEFPVDCAGRQTMITLPFQAGWSNTWKWSK